MLTVTPTAAEAIQLLVESAELDAGGVRISAGEPTPQGTPLSLELVERPEPEDEVVGGDAAVFLEPQVAAYLDQAILDAQVDKGEIAFALRDGEEPEPPSWNGASPQ